MNINLTPKQEKEIELIAVYHIDIGRSELLVKPEIIAHEALERGFSAMINEVEGYFGSERTDDLRKLLDVQNREDLK